MGRGGTVAQRATGVLLLLVVAGVLVAPRMPNNRYTPWVVALALAAVVLGWAAATRLAAPARRIPRRAWDLAAAVMVAAGSAAAFAVSWAGAYRATWDVEVVTLASTLAPGGFGPFLEQYFSRYPNLVPLLAVTRATRSAGDGLGLDHWTVFGLLNTLALATAAVALHLTVRAVRGPAWGALGVAVLFALLGASPWLAVPYTDMLVVWVPITALALVAAALRDRRPRKLALLAVAGLVLGAGTTLKVTPAVGLVALLLTLLLTAARGSRGWAAAAAGVTVAGFALAATGVGAWAASAALTPPLDPDRAATPLTYVAAGMRVQHDNPVAVTYGGYDVTVWRRTRDLGREAQNEEAGRLIRETWRERGPAGMIGFEAGKTLFTWGDGMFWAWGEGTDAQQPPLREGAAVSALASWNRPGGEHVAARVAAAQVLWLAVLLAAGAGLLRSRARPEILLAVLTVAGIAAFTLLFQGRSRYLIPHVPVLVMLAVTLVPAHVALGRPRLPRAAS